MSCDAPTRRASAATPVRQSTVVPKMSKVRARTSPRSVGATGVSRMRISYVKRLTGIQDRRRTRPDAGAGSGLCEERQKRSTRWGAPLLSRTARGPPASALGVRRGAGELDADEGLITDDTGVVSRRDRV